MHASARDSAWPAALAFTALLAGAAPGAAQLHGRAEIGTAARFSDAGPRDERLLDAESRLLLERQWYGEGGEMLDVRILAVQPYRGDARLELRQASVLLPLGTRLEIAAGRQVLSWGPAQYEFVNDRFAKDFESFFVGRDLEYLKAPNDALRVRAFPGAWTADLVLTPVHQADRMPDPARFPVLDPATGRPVADSDFRAEAPDPDITNGEAHLRLSRRVGRWEAALYGFRGFTGAAEGVRDGPDGPVAFHPRLDAVGASLRGPLFGGVGWMEGALEEVWETGSGTDPRLPPDRWQALAGFRWSPAPTRTWMLQASAVGQMGAAALRETLGEAEPGHPRTDAVHYRLQSSLTQSFLSERLDAGARVFWGVTEEDAHLRLRLAYEVSDELEVELRLHGFAAGHPASRFGLLEEHDLAAFRVRYHL